MSEVKCVRPAREVMGEGPLWDEASQVLYWVDIKNPAVHRYTPATRASESWPMPEFIGCVALRASGGMIAGLRSGFAFLDLDSGTVEPIGNPEPELPGNRLNDGTCDEAGRFWVGSMDNAEREPTGSFYRLDPNLEWTRVDSGYVVSNGPAISPDGRSIYHTDSARRTIFVSDLSAEGEWRNKRVFLQFAAGDGFPDGMTVDADGCLWVAFWGGWRVSRFAPDGAKLCDIALPAAQITCCTFGGPRLDTLYITSASIGLDEAQRAAQPLAGGLFEVAVDARGVAACRFGG